MAREYYFRHHFVEARRNRFRLLVAIGVIMVGAVAFLVPSIISLAASSTTADLDGVKILNSGGGQYGGTTTGSFASATVTAKRVSSGVSTSSTANPFSFLGLAAVAAGDHYLVSVSPVTVGGYTVKGLTWCQDGCAGFDAQNTNFRSGSATDFTFSPNHVYHMRWIYQPVPTPAPTAASASAPTPPPATPVSTPKPAVKPSAQPTTAPATPKPAPDTTVPTQPGNFSALVAGDNALVTLSWTASSDAVGVKAYKLERSLDQHIWTVLADGLSALSFRDDTVAFAIHYYYRLSASDVAGNVSAYAFVEGTTGEFAANSMGSSPGSYVSDDQIASVDLPAGALNDSASCTVVATDKLGSSEQPLVAGPYTLICKSSTGAVITEFNKPVTWHFALHNKIKALINPIAVSVDGATVSSVEGAVYDANAQTMQFNQTRATTTAVLASVKHGISPNIVVIGVFLLLLIAGVLIAVLRKSQRENYNEYLRKKYYDL